MLTFIRSILLLVALLAAGQTIAQTSDLGSLYQAQAIVTGTGEENRKLGFGECLREVLVKVSGDQRLADDLSVTALLEDAGQYATSFSYRDRLEGIPIHDEQGTHDRPHDLTCIYEPARIDEVLASLGSRPWLERRPELVLLLAVRDSKRTFALARDSAESPYMVESFLAAARPLGMTVSVPDRQTLSAAGLDPAAIRNSDIAALDVVAKGAGGDMALAGSIEWSDADLGWVVEWRLDLARKTHRWRTSGVSFDEAFRVGLRGAAQILSGNGDPE